MGQLDNFNMNDLLLMIVGVSGAFASLILVLQKSKCEEINLLCCKCKRRVDLVIAEEKLKLTGKTGLTPKVKDKDLKLELKNPEPEPEPEDET